MISLRDSTLATLLTCGTFSGCSREQPATEHAPSSPSGNAAARASASALATQRTEPTQADLEPDVPSPAAPATVSSAPPALRGAHPHWLVDEAVELGPAGRAAATQFGALMLTRNNELRLAPVGKLSSKAQDVRSPINPLAIARDAVELARGPSVLGKRVYWIATHQLMTAELGENGRTSPAQVLASDAKSGTRVAVPKGMPGANLPHSVAYIAKNPEDPQVTIAKLWSESSPPLSLTPAGAAASSVALTSSGDDVIAWSMEGRTGMSPVHVREVHFQGNTPQLQEDRVVWVGGASQPFSEIVALPAGAETPARALLATEQDVSHFGLLTLTLSGGTESQPSWSLYPNGIDPAPVASAHLCGHTVIVRVKPQSAQGATPQELELVTADANSASPPLIIAYAQRFFDVSLATLADGALLVTVADERTWATTLRCRSR